jgi:hypothetical protein
MRRRDFILAGGATVAWPLAARAQQPERMRRMVLMALPEADPAAQELLSEFTQGLAELGWTAGGKMRMDVRWARCQAGLVRHTMLRASQSGEQRQRVVAPDSLKICPRGLGSDRGRGGRGCSPTSLARGEMPAEIFARVRSQRYEPASCRYG